MTVATPPIAFDTCPVCESDEVKRLPDDWQAQLNVHRGTDDVLEGDRSIPLIGCGNPWHYATQSLGDAPRA